ncbi:MAG: transcriptional regulator, AraC family [Caulobacteraceae bacterium]|nr:transcriptional regulator, AraC family [Caulobacteraceae bacterium]
MDTAHEKLDKSPARGARARCAVWFRRTGQITAVPQFFLFGEPPKAIEQRFMHLESLAERSRPNAWNIRPHAHANLSHIFHIETGSGRMEAEGGVVAFTAPCALLVPARVVHGFTYKIETTGQVLTIAKPYLDDLDARDPELAALFDRAHSLEVGDYDLGGRMAELGRELVWAAPGHTAAVEFRLMEILVTLLRRMRSDSGRRLGQTGPQAELVARFRALVEARFRTGARVDAYAAGLGVSPARLREACQRITGFSPTRLIQERIVLEARRALLYSNMTVAELAHGLGFDDPAYFSRFFTRQAGQSPRAFRACRNR